VTQQLQPSFIAALKKSRKSDIAQPQFNHQKR
jgi:hypothetical protein